MKSINQLQQSIGIYCRLQLFLSNLRVFIFPNRNAFLLSLLLLLTGPNNRLLAFEDAKELWPLIQTQLEESGTDTARQFIFLLVRGHCGDNYHCLYPAYSVVKEKVERRFDLSTAIEICREMLKIAHQQGDLNGEAHAHSELARYYSALGDEKEAVINTEKAWSLYEQAGNHQAINLIRLVKLENRLHDEDIQVVLPDLEKLLAELIEMKDTANMNYLNLRLIHLSQWAGEYGLMAKHVAAAEKVLVAEPTQQDDYWFAIHTFRGRADLALMDQDLDGAEQFYQKALQYSMEMPDHWLEIRTLHSLAELEMERGKNDLAISYLDSAQIKAEALEMEDLLTANFNLKAAVAESEGRYAEALDFTKKKQLYEEKLKSKSAGFDAKNFYLEKEKEQLAAEKEKQELELKIKNGRLRNLFNIIGLGILLIAALGLSLYTQRKSKRKLAVQNELIQKQAERLANLDAAKSRFFANVSHELRTPLSLLLGPISQLIKENKLNERQNRLLKMASESGKQLGQLVNEILDLGKMEMGKMGLEQQPTKLSAFFRHYLLQFESLAYRKQVDFSFDLKMDPNLTALIDQAKCRQVLYNLLSNAFKFTPEGGAIKASFFVNNNLMCMEVADSGPGIHPDDLPHVFDRYFQTNQSGQPASGGSGIGLALCHEYAQLFDGKISVNSQLGNGAVFRFEFPVETVAEEQLAASSQLVEWKEVAALQFDPESEKKQTPNPACSPNKAKPTVLVVEDNLELQDYIRLILEEKYNVLTAENGRVALEVLSSTVSSSAVRQSSVGSSTVLSSVVRQSGNQIEASDCRTADCQAAGLKKIDLILTDLMMPVMDGYQLIEQLKSDDATRHIPVVMLTARAEMKDKLKALRLGVDDYLLKPFDGEELLARTENLLKNQWERRRFSSSTVGSSQFDSRQLAVRQSGIPTDTPDCRTVELKTVELQTADCLTAEDSEWLARLEENLQSEIPKFDFKLEQLAELMLVSRRQLGRQVKALTGLTPSEYLLEARLQRARSLLDENQVKTVKELAYVVGLRDAKHFSRQFKTRFGKSPSELLEQRFN